MSENLGKNIAEIFRDKYVIPLYQRNYAWREDEIVQLLQDIFVSFKSNSKSHYYIGSLVVLKRRNGIFEVIDGQQRLTTLSLIVRLLEKHQSPVLSYDSRPAVEEFFETYLDLELNINPVTVHVSDSSTSTGLGLDGSQPITLKQVKQNSAISQHSISLQNNLI